MRRKHELQKTILERLMPKDSSENETPKQKHIRKLNEEYETDNQNEDFSLEEISRAV